VTRSNRVANRVILLIIGLLALGLAAVIALPSLPTKLFGMTVPRWNATALTEAVNTALARGLTVTGCVVVIVLALVWIFTRGRGRTGAALGGVASDPLSVDVKVIEELLRDALQGDPDLLATSANGFRVRGRAVVRVRLSVRRGAELRRLTDTVRRAVSELDTALGAELPILVHITSGLRASIAHEQRVA
jgi:hypothetical protein